MKSALIFCLLAALLLSPACAEEPKQIWIVCDGSASVSADAENHLGDIGIVSHGQSYELLGIYGNQAKLRNHKGEIGYVYAGFISDEDPNTLDLTLYAQVSGEILCTNSNARHKYKKYSMEKGEAIQAVAVTPNGGWYRVQRNGKYYYVLREFLAETPPPEEGRILVNTLDSLTVYATSTISENVVTDLEKGEQVHLIGVGKSCGRKIRTADGKIGYVAGGLEPLPQ